MSTSAELLGDRCDIQLSFAAQAYPEPAVGKLAEKRGDLYILDRKRIIHQSFAVLFLRSKTFHLFAGNPNPGQRPFAMQVRKRRAQQTHLGGGVSEIYVACAVRGIGA